MFIPNLIAAFSKLCLASRIIKGMGSLLLGGIALWWVVEQVGPTHGTVLVHVTEPDVEVTIGDSTFPIKERRYDPLECQLQPGKYALRMMRGDSVLYEESFTVHRGEEIILTASCPREPSMAPAPNKRRITAEKVRTVHGYSPGRGP
jgi:hypothetical protein